MRMVRIAIGFHQVSQALLERPEMVEIVASQFSASFTSILLSFRVLMVTVMCSVCSLLALQRKEVIWTACINLEAYDRGLILLP